VGLLTGAFLGGLLASSVIHLGPLLYRRRTRFVISAVAVALSSLPPLLAARLGSASLAAWLAMAALGVCLALPQVGTRKISPASPVPGTGRGTAVIALRGALARFLHVFPLELPTLFAAAFALEYCLNLGGLGPMTLRALQGGNVSWMTTLTLGLLVIAAFLRVLSDWLGPLLHPRAVARHGRRVEEEM
jgi:hypothetical protein